MSKSNELIIKQTEKYTAEVTLNISINGPLTDILKLKDEISGLMYFNKKYKINTMEIVQNLLLLDSYSKEICHKPESEMFDIQKGLEK